MTAYLVISKFDNLNIENFRIGVVKNTKYAILRYLDQSGQSGLSGQSSQSSQSGQSRRHLYLQTPNLHLGNFIGDKTGSVRNKNKTDKTDKTTTTDKIDKTTTSDKISNESASESSDNTSLCDYAFIDLYLNKDKVYFRKFMNELDIFLINKIWQSRY